MISPFRKTGKSGRGRPSKSATPDFATLAIKCSFCGNKFYARPREAVCPKCERPANRDLDLIWRVASLLLPPLGVGYALLLRPHSPLAAFQGFRWSLGGALLWLALALMRAL